MFAPSLGWRTETRNNLRPLQNCLFGSELVATGRNFSSFNMFYFVSLNPAFPPPTFITLYQESYQMLREETSTASNFLLKYSDRLTWCKVFVLHQIAFFYESSNSLFFSNISVVKEDKPTGLLLLQLSLSLGGKRKLRGKENKNHEGEREQHAPFLCPPSLTFTKPQLATEMRNSRNTYYSPKQTLLLHKLLPHRRISGSDCKPLHTIFYLKLCAPAKAGWYPLQVEYGQH